MKTPEIKTGLCLDSETLRDILIKHCEYDDDEFEVDTDDAPSGKQFVLGPLALLPSGH